MADDKPPTKRLGRLTPGAGKSKDGVRLGSLREDGAEAGTSVGAGASGLLSRFKPKNFAKAEQGPVPETKLAESLPDPNARRSNRNNRGGRGGGGRGSGTGGGRIYESEVVFGGITGAGAKVQTETKTKAEPEFEPDLPITSPTATTKTKSTPSKRLVKANGAAAAGDASGASGSKPRKKKEKDVSPKSESDASAYSSSDTDDDDDGIFGAEDEYLPTLLASLGKGGGAHGVKKSSRGGNESTAPVTTVPEELMARAPENEVELNRQLSWLTEPSLENPGLVLFQLPSVLPIPVPFQGNGGGIVGADGAIDLTGNVGCGGASTRNGAGPSTTASAKAAEGRPASLAELPPGKIGKLLVLRNGSVKMQIGEVLFDVSPGIPCQMLQEFAAVDPSNKTITMLGEIEKRIVVTPNIDSLLSEDPLPEWKYTNKSIRGGGAAVSRGRGAGGGAAAAAAKEKKIGGARGAAVIDDSDSSSSSSSGSSSSDDDEEMEDAGGDRNTGKNGVAPMIEDDDEATQDEEDEALKGKKISRPAPKARKTRK